MCIGRRRKGAHEMKIYFFYETYIDRQSTSVWWGLDQKTTGLKNE